MSKRKYEDECERDNVKVLKADEENELKTKLKYFVNENVSTTKESDMIRFQFNLNLLIAETDKRKCMAH